ncbi:MAG: ECF-type sigma factor [Planctomycetota bacterium]
MPTISPRTITKLLQGVRDGETRAAESLLEEAYSELGQLARMQLAGERQGHTLQPTALVHEAWLKLAGHIDRVDDRKHFFALASQAMRRVLTDHAKGRNRQKRGGGDAARVTLQTGLAAANEQGFGLVELDDTLQRLAALNERHARVVELRIFGGLTIAEAAEVLAVSHTTIETDWFTAKAWLRTELGRTG